MKRRPLRTGVAHALGERGHGEREGGVAAFVRRWSAGMKRRQLRTGFAHALGERGHGEREGVVAAFVRRWSAEHCSAGAWIDSECRAMLDAPKIPLVQLGSIHSPACKVMNITPGKVSVIIPTFNRKGMLQEALGSAKAQTYDQLEIIVVDDGSTDGTFEALQSDSEIQVVRQGNAGPSAARNHGLRKARGEFLAFLDSDDLWESEFLAGCVKGLQQSGAGLAFANWRIVGAAGEALAEDAFAERENLTRALEGNDAEWIPLEPHVIRDLFIRKSFIMPSGMLFRRSSFSHDWDESLQVGEDQKFILQGLFAGEVAAVCTRRRLWTYRFHDSNHCTNNPERSRVSRGEIRVKQETLNCYEDSLTSDQRKALRGSLAASWRDLGYHLAGEGDRTGAVRAYGKAYRLRPDWRTAWGGLRAVFGARSRK